MSKQGLLLMNLGSPDSPEVTDVRRYLRQFLSDPRVIDIPAAVRWLLLNLVILPTRPKESSHAYKQIWTERGSPLKWHTEDLAKKVQNLVSDDTVVTMAMRYQNPSIKSALEFFREKGVDRITVLPLFPQYSSAATGSATEAVLAEVKSLWNTPQVEVLQEFYDQPGFIDPFVNVGKESLGGFDADFVIFSFHGVPERHCTKSDESNGEHCLKSKHCCDAIVDANRRCYRAQCFETARLMAAKLELPADKWEVTFQSRLGRTPWIKPYTDERIKELAAKGTKRLAVYSPAFVADCLETIEEIGMRAKEDFLEAGGEDLRLIPSLNSRDDWAEGLVNIVKSMVGREI